MNQKNKTKQNRKVNSNYSKAETLDGVLGFYKDKGQGNLFHLWQVGVWKRVPRSPLHSEVSWGANLILSRRQCAWLLLQLQHQLRWKPMGIRSKTRPRKGKRTLPPKKTNTKSNSRVVRGKNSALRTIIGGDSFSGPTEVSLKSYLATKKGI